MITSQSCVLAAVPHEDCLNLYMKHTYLRTIEAEAKRE